MKFVYLFIVAGCGIFGFNAKRNTTEMVTISAGQRVYIAEGCINCHSQYARPHSADLENSGPATLFLSYSAQPVLIGNRRQGPDLSNIGARRSREWNRQHLINPQLLSPGSRMPSYGHLFDGEQVADGEALLDYLESLVTEDLEAWWNTVYNWTPTESKQGSVNAGQKLFSQNCSQCHGNEARGDGPIAPSLTTKPADLVHGLYRLAPKSMPGPQRENRVAQLIKYGQAGTSMPGHEYLTDQNVVDLMAYLDSITL